LRGGVDHLLWTVRGGHDHRLGVCNATVPAPDPAQELAVAAQECLSPAMCDALPLPRLTAAETLHALAPWDGVNVRVTWLPGSGRVAQRANRVDNAAG
jgi:hypothetical protein